MKNLNYLVTYESEGVIGRSHMKDHKFFQLAHADFGSISEVLFKTIGRLEVSCKLRVANFTVSIGINFIQELIDLTGTEAKVKFADGISEFGLRHETIVVFVHFVKNLLEALAGRSDEHT
jgi:hypothetical protein